MISLGLLSGLFLTVGLGALVPVVPTGAAVGSAAAVTLTDASGLVVVLVVVLVAAAAALFGDIALWALLRQGGEPIRRWYAARISAEEMQRQERRLRERPVLVLVASRLIPGGRIPVMLAAILTGQSWRWFLVGDAAAVLGWAAVYAGLGAVGGQVFDNDWHAIAVVVVVVVLIGVGPGLFRRLAQRTSAPT